MSQSKEESNYPSYCVYFVNEINGFYTCQLFHDDAVVEENIQARIVGNHLENMDDGDVVQVFSESSHINVIPTKICKQFKNLQEIILNSDRIEQLTQNTFSNCRNLVKISLEANRIHTIHKDTFDELSTLTHLYLSNNLITKLNKDTFKNLKQLQILFLSNNDFKTLNPEILENLKQLRQLNLNRLRLSSLSDEIFQKNVNLNSVDLSENNLTSISADLLKPLPDLITLDLSYNQIKTIHRSAFDSQLHLKNLLLNDNQLSTLNVNWFFRMNPLLLVLRRNQIDAIPEGIFAKFKQINYLSLSDNKLGVINSNIFDVSNRMPTNFFYLDGNQIDAIDRKLMNVVNVTVEFNLYNNLCVSYVFKGFGSIGNRLDRCFNNFDDIPVVIKEPTTSTADSTTENSLPSTETTAEETTSKTISSTRLTMIPSTSSTSLTTPQTGPKPIKSCNFYIDDIHGYTCELSIVSYMSESDKFDLAGNHINGKNDADVHAVVFKSSSLFSMPNIIFRQFENLQYLNIKGTRMTTIDESFSSCSNLKWLDASNNEIRNLASNDFSNCHDLQTLLLDDNYIMRIEPCNHFISKLEQLGHLSMKSNICIDDTLNGNDLYVERTDLIQGKLARCFSAWFIR